MPRKKNVRFQEIQSFSNVVEENKDNYNSVKGEWQAAIFKNSQPITLELGCGKGEYTVGLAEVFPAKNFVGVDVRGDRIWRGASRAIENKLHNAAFLRAQIELLDNFFAPGEVSEIWITFPDPRPKIGDTKKRLTSPRFLQIYHKLLTLGGLVHLKTDNGPLFEYSLYLVQKMAAEGTLPVQQIEFTRDLYDSEFLADQRGIQTTFEKKYLALGQPIYYLRFRMG